MNIEKVAKKDFNVLAKKMSRVSIKAQWTDKGGTFDIYDAYDEKNNLIALNRYVFVDNQIERPYIKLTEAEVKRVKQ